MPAPARKAAEKKAHLNALRHGLTGQTVVMPGEDLALFNQHCRDYQEHFQPIGRLESEFVQTMAEIRWRLNRVISAEINMAALHGADKKVKVQSGDGCIDYALATSALLRDGSHSFVNVSLYEQRLARQYELAHLQLRCSKAGREYDARQRKREQRHLEESNQFQAGE